MRLSFQTGGEAASTRRRRASGFTLIELMVTVAVLAVLISLAIPSFVDVTLGSKLRAQANDLVAAVSLARSEAIKRNERVTLCASTNGSSCLSSGGWHQGWIMRTTDGTVIGVHAASPSGFQITDTDGGALSVDLLPSGAASDSLDLKVCRSSPSVGDQERLVKISLTGRAYVTKTTTGSCS
ncbi:prepilin-type N-terminal cleavage/methylation domain-containing protein [Pseudomonas sp. BN417]|uniref:GspH/FimT family pseudopilin n=1 Tax=Pseudomonas sp. BN417 TaxID=2567890 RepID=UPI002458AD1A|nr:GspH/FimT family pseudopilin [Pseudomonas sp. BN417]MDH4556802.1 prepilin-type N-terminal cleavage/methylation domain-containing protein [Pseudomonas sp. BN417]